MKQISLLACLCLSFAVNAQSGKKIILGTRDTIYSQLLGEKREVWVYLPDTTGMNSKKRYPVVYLLDGDVHFYAVAGMLQFLSQVTQECPEMILVGILNTDRMHDLTPTHDGTVPKDSDLVRTSGGGEQFTHFLEKELIPFIDAHYPTSPYRVLSGHSLGGLLTINTLVNHPDMFNAYIAVDPAVFWDNQKVIRQAEVALKQRLRSKSLYVGWSGTVPSNKDSILNDHSVATIVERSKLQLSRLISECSVGSLCNREKYYSGEEHNSVPFVANYDALRFLFSFTKPPKTEPISATPEFYSRHYKMVSERIGYTVLPPEELVNGLGYKFLRKKMFDRAQAFFQLNIDNYPDSYNVYDSMSDLYAAEGDKSKAIEYLNKEIKLKDLPYIRQKLSELRAGK